MKQTTWDGQSKGSRTGTWIFIKIIQYIGLLPAYALLHFISLLYTLFDRKNRKLLFKFHQKVHPKPGFYQIYKHYCSFGLNLIDSISFLHGYKDRFHFSSTGEDFFHDALAEKKGVIMLSAHVGNWEIAGNLLSGKIDTKVNFVMLDNEKESMKKIMQPITDNRGISIISVHPGSTDMIIELRNALKRNEIVCFLGDRIVDNAHAMHVPFLGTKASFPIGPYAIATITDSPVIVAFAVRKKLKHYYFKAYSKYCIKTGGKKERNSNIEKALKEYVAILEDIVRKHPYQWCNFYDFWGELDKGNL